MKKLFIFLSLLFLLVACVKEDLPPSPPPPGGSVGAGKAVGGIQIDSSRLPSWATVMRDADISPVSVYFNDTVVVKVLGDYVFKNVYFLNKFRVWEPVVGSGSRVGDWFSDRGDFFIPIKSDKLAEGPVYVISYGCDDTGRKDSAGKIIWNCNRNTNKWALGSFKIELQGIQPVCGNNVVESSEECEFTSNCSDDEVCINCSCVAAPLVPYCGDEIVNNNEQCEVDADCASGKVCDDNCTCITPPAIVCGDGIKVGSEECDDNNTISNDGCNSNCELEYCGDNVTQSNEQCELGDSNCDENCMLIACGNNITQPGEECDPPDISANCDGSCKFICGNNKLDAGEQCDGTADNLCPGKCDDKCRCETPVGIWKMQSCETSGLSVSPCFGVDKKCAIDAIENNFCSNINYKCIKMINNNEFLFTCKDLTAYKWTTHSVSLCGNNCDFNSNCEITNPEGVTCDSVGKICVIKERSVKQLSCEIEMYDFPGVNNIIKIPGSTYSLEKECPPSMDCEDIDICKDIWVNLTTKKPSEGDICFNEINKECPCPANCSTIGNFVKHEYICSDVTVPKWLQTADYGKYDNCPSGIQPLSECKQTDLGKICRLSDSVILKCYGNKLSTTVTIPAAVFEPTGYMILSETESSNSGVILFIIAVLGIFAVTFIHFKN